MTVPNDSSAAPEHAPYAPLDAPPGDTARALAAAMVKMMWPCEVTQVWRDRDVVSGGAIVLHSRERADEFHQQQCLRRRSPLERPAQPCAIETAYQYVWPSGMKLTTAWRGDS